MNEMEILEIVKDPDRLNFLADQFRQGRDIGDLVILLNSDSDAVVAAAAWIAGEIDNDLPNAQLLVPCLQQLVKHNNPSIRFHAIGALYPFLNKADPAVKEMFIQLGSDPDEAVRSIAHAALRRSQSQK